MTRADLTHIHFLLDRSGSMGSIRSDIEEGFGAFIHEQRSRTAGECRVTLARFDDRYEEVYTDLPLDRVPPLALEPRGMTALLDSMGRLITDAGARLAALPESARPGTVIVAVMTDGMENASQEWTHPAIRALVEGQTRKYGWQFLYMGADQDAVEVGAGIGIPRDYAVTFSRGKARQAMAAAAGRIGDYRDERLVCSAAPMVPFSDEERDELV